MITLFRFTVALADPCRRINKRHAICLNTEFANGQTGEEILSNFRIKNLTLPTRH